MRRTHIGFLEQGRREPSLSTLLILAERLEIQRPLGWDRGREPDLTMLASYGLFNLGTVVGAIVVLGGRRS
jgi:hypothetical protein